MVGVAFWLGSSDNRRTRARFRGSRRRLRWFCHEKPGFWPDNRRTRRRRRRVSRRVRRLSGGYRHQVFECVQCHLADGLVCGSGVIEMSVSALDLTQLAGRYVTLRRGPDVWVVDRLVGFLMLVTGIPAAAHPRGACPRNPWSASAVVALQLVWLFG